MSGIFVTGTDTDIGKTVVSSFLGYLLSFDKDVTYFKPIQAGAPFDREVVRDLCGESVKIKASSYQLKLPASPDRAARGEGLKIDLSIIKEDFDSIENSFKIVEGAGGLMVPLNESETMADLAGNLDLPIILVVSGKLGTINHTLLTLEKIRAQGLDCRGIIISGEEDPELQTYFETRLDAPVLLRLPYFSKLSSSSFDEFIEKNFSQLQSTRKILLDGKSLKKTSEELSEKDKKYVWHPFTQHGIVKEHPIVRKGKGSFLFLDNKKVIDGISSWWVNLFGHSHPELSQTIKHQVDQLEHVIFAGFSHEPAIELSEKLINLTRRAGASFQKVFFSDNGSTSVEVAVKMAFQFQQQQGRPNKNRFLAFKGSYHGDTLGAMSVGERKGFNEIFEPLMFPVDFVDPFKPEEVEKAFTSYGDLYAGVILEPMVQGASGMRMYPKEVLDLVSDLAERYKSLVICDEVFTGFYRTGKLFAFEHSKLKPDLLCLSKGLTGGFLPLAVTLATNDLYEAFFNQDMRKAFLHGHSYTANPMACAVASKTMDLISAPETREKIIQITKWTKSHLAELAKLPGVTGVRQLGTIGAMEINGEDPNYFKGDFSYQFMRKAMDRGVLLRPLGGTVYSVPPYCINQIELQKIYETMSEVITKDLT